MNKLNSNNVKRIEYSQHKLISHHILDSDDKNVPKEDFDDIFLLLDEFITSNNKEIVEFVEKCKNTINQKDNINIKKQNSVKRYNTVDKDLINVQINDIINKSLNYFYLEKHQKEILKNKLFIPIKILQECIQSFMVKYKELYVEIEDAFPKYFKHIKGFLDSLEDKYINDTVRYLMKADIYSIFI